MFRAIILVFVTIPVFNTDMEVRKVLPLVPGCTLISESKNRTAQLGATNPLGMAKAWTCTVVVQHLQITCSLH